MSKTLNVEGTPAVAGAARCSTLGMVFAVMSIVSFVISIAMMATGETHDSWVVMVLGWVLSVKSDLADRKMSNAAAEARRTGDVDCK